MSGEKGWSDLEGQDRLRQQAKRALRYGQSVSDAEVHAYYTEQAANTMLPAKERAQWKRLADDLWRRIKPKRLITEDDVPLFDEPPR